MNRPTIEIGQQCYATTSLSSVNLLCVITAIQGNRVTVKLPCKLKGYTHVDIPIKDIVLKQQSKQAINEKPKPPAPKDNPYRRHLENLLANPQRPPKVSVAAPQTSPKSQPISSSIEDNDMLAIYLKSLPIEQRKRDIMNLGKGGQKYHYLLEVK